jgi:hypothetical protein
MVSLPDFRIWVALLRGEKAASEKIETVPDSPRPRGWKGKNCWVSPLTNQQYPCGRGAVKKKIQDLGSAVVRAAEL